IKPTCITNKNGQPKAVISSNDAVIIFNYRADRARQLVKLFLSNDPDLPKRNISSPLYFTTMTPYETDWKLKINVAFKPTIPNITLSDLLAQNNLSQIHIAETEKYPHVTYFFNGGNNKENILEKLIAVPSAKLSSYDQKPQMSLMEINLTLKKELSNNLAEFVLVNYANCDMVGHTGNFDAIRKAISAVDFYLKDLIAHLSNLGYKIFITADHGNAEQAINPVTKNIDKEHTINPVFFIIVNVKDTNLDQTYINHQSLWIKLASELKKGILVDVTATVASSLGIKSDLFSGQKIL
ncbi:MAG: PglZ domain-containing protein, partial [Patescibacteria group bacterium]|nr:PglZ domain-containing protein [Patescibacteria group bacterium]